MQDAWRAYLELAMGVTESSRKRAQSVARKLVGQGGATAAQLQALAEELRSTGLANREAMTKLVRFEVDRALGVVGLATQEEVASLHERVAELERELRSARTATAGPSGPQPGGVEPDAAAPETAAKKAVAKKAVAKKAVAAPAVASPEVARHGVAKEAVAKKTVAKKTAASLAKKAAAEQAPPATAKKIAAKRLPRPAKKVASEKLPPATGTGEQ
ncbi:phasin family protein [Micromonospora sp. NPDC050417]|uniref:phasin family protein n=1 Tax=Micromonospora sp. NPDC050417 TaxID=3364280 RepID=UPI0037AE2384